MKKSTIVKLYNELDNKEIIEKDLPKMISVKGDAEDIFYDLCIKYNDILDSDILDHFISISTFVSSLDDSLERKRLLDSIYNIFDNDYLVSNMDFNIILENIEYIMATIFSKVFDVYNKEDEKNYASEIIIELSNGLSRYKDYDINKIYDHDLDVIFSRFFSVLEDLNNTKIPNGEYYNKTLMNRVKVFLDIIFSKEIYELDDYKYNVVLGMASTIDDINELSKFKKKILFYSRLNNEDFEVTLDDSVDTLTDTSIKLLKEGKSKVLKFPENSSNNK
ncbi:unknown [Clostridium sp. CAG:433]|nr:unknown [Clostridium sp. CAG:433]